MLRDCSQRPSRQTSWPASLLKRLAEIANNMYSAIDIEIRFVEKDERGQDIYSWVPSLDRSLLFVRRQVWIAFQRGLAEALDPRLDLMQLSLCLHFGSQLSRSAF